MILCTYASLIIKGLAVWHYILHKFVNSAQPALDSISTSKFATSLHTFAVCHFSYLSACHHFSIYVRCLPLSPDASTMILFMGDSVRLLHWMIVNITCLVSSPMVDDGWIRQPLIFYIACNEKQNYRYLFMTCTIVEDIAIFEGYDKTFYISGTHLKESEGTAHVAQNHIRMESCGRALFRRYANFWAFNFNLFPSGTWHVMIGAAGQNPILMGLNYNISRIHPCISPVHELNMALDSHNSHLNITWLHVRLKWFAYSHIWTVVQ